MTSSPVALQPDRVSADEFERLSVRLRASLDVSVAHGRTGADERDDAAQQIVLRVLQGSITSVIFSEGEVELKARMERELDRRRQSDRRERDVVGRSGSRGIVGLNAPPLCPTLARRLGASFHGELDEAAAVCAREPGVLRDGQFRAFVNAYEDGWSIADIAAVQGKSPRAVAELLRRVAKRVEQNLFLRLRAVGIDLAADGALLHSARDSRNCGAHSGRSPGGHARSVR